MSSGHQSRVRRTAKQGFEGGEAPLASPAGRHTECGHGGYAGLSPLTCDKPALGRLKSAFHSDARDGGGRAVTGELPRPSHFASRTDGDGGASCCAARCPPYPYPSETRYRRS